MNYKWIALSNTTIGTLMASLDRNIIVIALPSIASELHTSLITLVWIAIGYWVVTASVLLTFGRLADMFGRVKLYNIGFALFTIGSTLCCVSQTGEQLIVFRVVQALGAAFLFSNSAAILTDVFPENERGRALGLNQISIVVGSVIGLTIGGFLTSYLGWRSIFWINIPIGLFATVWSYAKLRELGTIRKEKIDWFGNAALSGGMVLLLVGITFGSFQIIDAIASILVILGGAALLTLFYLVEKKVSQPMFDLSLFKIKLFASSNMAIFLNALARGAFTLVMVFYLQGPSMRLDPLNAGIYLIPVSLALAIFAPVSGWLYDKFKLQIFTPIGLIVSAVGFLMLAGIGETTAFYESLMPLVLVGAGMGIFASPNRASIMSSVPSHRRGVAAGISTTLVMTGSAFSIGLVFLVFTQVMPLDAAQSIFTGSFDALNINGMGVDKFMISVHIIFFVSAIIMVISVIPSIIKWVT
ncbi:MAG: MFS transporter [Thermoproteota archaeon]|nr:MFS transporter [Thermoproteota archaeon]